MTESSDDADVVGAETKVLANTPAYSASIAKKLDPKRWYSAPPTNRMAKLGDKGMEYKVKRLAVMMSMGMTQKDACAHMDMTIHEYDWAISQHVFKKYMVELENRADHRRWQKEVALWEVTQDKAAGNVEMQRALSAIQSAAFDAVQVLREIANDADVPAKIRMESAAHILDRTGFVKGQDVFIRNTSSSATVEVINASMKELGAELIDPEESDGKQLVASTLPDGIGDETSLGEGD